MTRWMPRTGAPSGRPRVLRHVPRWALIATALAVAGAACATAHSLELQRIRRSNVKVLPGAEGFQNPLTGVVSYAPQEWQKRRVLAVKIGNSNAERPQAGIDKADVIYEELVEGGITRFMALFLTNSAERVGPVRSVRNVDPDIAESYHALFAYSGGVPPVVSKLHAAANLRDVGADRSADAYRRDDNRNAPYNLYTSTDELWSGNDGSPPGPQFSFLKSDEDPTQGGEKGQNVRFKFAGDSAEVSFVYNTNTGLYERFMNGEAHTVEHPGTNQQLAFRNVIVEMVNVTAGSTIDRAGNLSNEIQVVGGGSAVLFRGGKAIRGRWTRSSREVPMQYIDESGQPLRLAPGSTMIEMVPAGQELFVS